MPQNWKEAILDLPYLVVAALIVVPALVIDKALRPPSRASNSDGEPSP